MDSNFKAELISEKNNTYEFSIEFNSHTEIIFIYAPNYKTALSIVNNYSKHLEQKRTTCQKKL